MPDCRSLIGTVCAVCLSAFAARAETFVDYPAGAATAGDSQSFTLVPVSTGRKHDLQPLGRDGWRRVDGHGRAFVSVIRGGDRSGQCVRFTRAPWWTEGNRDSFAHIVHPIGRTFTSGKVSIQADLSTPDVWHFRSRRIVVGLGNAALAVSRGTEWDEFVAYAGIRGTEDAAAFCPGWSEPGQRDGLDPAVRLTRSCWFRVKLTVDLDAKTGEMRLYRIGGKGLSLGDDESSLELVYEKRGFGLYNDLGEVSALFVSVYGAGSTDSPREQVWLDNIKVLSGDFASGEVVYANDFDTRIRK